MSKLALYCDFKYLDILDTKNIFLLHYEKDSKQIYYFLYNNFTKNKKGETRRIVCYLNTIIFEDSEEPKNSTNMQNRYCYDYNKKDNQRDILNENYEIISWHQIPYIDGIGDSVVNFLNQKKTKIHYQNQLIQQKN